jgi:hypothetical protein
MNIEYFAPLSRGFEWMKSALFRPLDVRTWFVVGFTAFLAELGEFGSNVPSWRQSWKDDGSMDRLLRLPEQVSEWISEHPQLLVVILFGLALLVVIGVALLWISARGKFMFLDNVVHRRAQVKVPWSEFEHLGNSLFLWSLAFGVVCALIFIPLMILGFLTLREMYDAGEGFTSILMPVALMATVGGLVGIIVAFIELLLTDFVVLIMYRSKIKVLAAWRILLPLLRSHAGSFLLYAILKLFLVIVVIVAVTLIGCATCCLGFIILLMPYIGSVVRLPISYTFRAFGVYFLEQFGEGFTVFPPAPAEVDPQAPPSF